MTLPQGIAFAIVLATMALLVWGRIRYDLVALLALLASIATGIVPANKAFTGFSDDIVVIVGAALLISAAIARSGLVERLMRPIGAQLSTVRRQVFVLVAAVTLLSAFMKNIGALAIFMPVAFQIARRTGTTAACLLMPMSFGSLLGGLMTLIGTSPNIIVARLRAEILGQPFGMFDFLPVGLGIAVAGVAFLCFGYRLLPGGRRGAASLDAAFSIEGYTTEAVLPEGSPMVGKTVGDLEALGEGEVGVTTIIRERFRRYTPSAQWTLYAGDVLLLEGEPDALERLLAEAGLELAGEKGAQAAQPTEEIGVMEAVVTADSPIVDHSVSQLHLRERHQVNLLAVSRSGRRIAKRLRSVKFRPGDVVVLQGDLKSLPETLGELRVLPLAEREIRLGRGRTGFLPAVLLAAAMILVALHVVPVAIAFFGAAVLLMAFRVIPLREAYDLIDWPILILLGALIPVSEAIRTTGGTEVIAGWLTRVVDQLPPVGALAVVLVAAMAVTPFVSNAATVLMVGPIAVSLAGKLALSPDPFLIAVAVGAACDFLTPIGHQCNTLVWGPGGYRFSDYWKLGLPLSVIVVATAVPLIAWFWPLTPY